MWNDNEIEFQLKLHTLQNVIASKCQQIKTIQAKLDSLSSIKIQSEDQILTLVSQVHKNMKGVQRIVREIRQPCIQLELNQLYDLVKNMCCVLIGSIKLLSEGFENGVQRNLVKFRSQIRKQLQLTICTRQEAEDNRDEGQKKNKKIKIQEYSTDLQIQMEIDRLYQHILAQKQSVLRTSASNSFARLNEVRLSWMKLMGDSDQLLEEAFYRNIEELRQIPERTHKPEYLSKILKQELSQRIKSLFKQHAGRALKRMHDQFYSHQYQKIRQQILNERPAVKDQQQQTEVDCFSKIRQVLKEKKIGKQLQDAINQKKQEKRLTKQLNEAINQKKDLADQNTKISKNNQAYLSRIQELQKKLAKYATERSLQRKLSSQSRRSTAKFSRKNSLINDSVQEDKKISKTVNENQSSKYTTLEQSCFPGITEIIRKKNNLKRFNVKSRMHTQQFNSSTQKQFQMSQKLQAICEEDQGKNKDQSQKSQKMANKSLKNMEKSLKLVQEQQYISTMAGILEIVDKISSEEKERNSVRLQKTEEDKNGDKEAQSVAEKAWSNPQICSIFQNFVKRIVSHSIPKIQEADENALENQAKIPKPVKLSRIKQQKKLSSTQKPLIKKKSSKQPPVLTNNLLVKFLLLDNSQNNTQDHNQSELKFDQGNEKPQIQAYVENQIQRSLSKQFKKDSIKQIAEVNKIGKKQMLIEQKMATNQNNKADQPSDLFKKFSPSVQTKNMRNTLNIEGRFQKFHFSKPRLNTRQSRSNESNVMQSFDLNNYSIRPLTKIQEQIKTQSQKQTANSEKLICVKKIQPKSLTKPPQIVNVLIELCKNNKFEEVRDILNRYLVLNSRKSPQRQISQMPHKFLKGVKYRMERLDTS